MSSIIKDIEQYKSEEVCVELLDVIYDIQILYDYNKLRNYAASI